MLQIINPKLAVSELYVPLSIYLVNTGAQQKYEYTYIPKAIYVSKATFKNWTFLAEGAAVDYINASDQPETQFNRDSILKLKIDLPGTTYGTPIEIGDYYVLHFNLPIARHKAYSQEVSNAFVYNGNKKSTGNTIICRNLQLLILKPVSDPIEAGGYVYINESVVWTNPNMNLIDKPNSAGLYPRHLYASFKSGRQERPGMFLVNYTAKLPPGTPITDDAHL